MKKPLIIFEMANNHSGSLEQGKQILRAYKKLCIYERFDYAFKLQYRNLDTFVHKDSRDSGHKQVARFLSTALTEEQFIELKNEIVNQGFIPICTPFDESSVEKVVKHGYEYIKVASCSFTDWPLLEEIAKQDKPLILSTAGASLSDIDRVIEFFINREKQITLMHCVGEYPATREHAQLNQLDLLQNRYPKVKVGYSSHENPDDIMGAVLAVGKNAMVFERHVGVPTAETPLNAYSLNPEQTAYWLKALDDAFETCGVSGQRHEITEKEAADLGNLRRGVFAKEYIGAGQAIEPDNVYYAFPKAEGQLAANDMSKYIGRLAKSEIKADAPVFKNNVDECDKTEFIKEVNTRLIELLRKASVPIAVDSICEISHHYGTERFYEWGAVIIEVINRNYCKKLMVLLPGQKHPMHTHKQKEESFQVLYGDFSITVDGETGLYRPGDIVHVNAGTPHSFSSETGGIFEEVSTTHYINDSFYEDECIAKNPNRKTRLTLWRRNMNG